MYILISGFLVFTFYRDDFSISLVKNILQFSILTPIFIVVSAHILTKMSGRGFSKIAIYEWFKKIIGKTKFRMKKRF